jgi:hydrogenase expression/formation protein HypD
MDSILHYLLTQSKNETDGLICPGHVATIKGTDYFKFIAEDYHIPAAICGFETLDIVGGIHYLMKQITHNKKKSFENLYKRCVRSKGNPIANQLMQEVFKISHGEWRGIGRVENSSYILNEKYSDFDAEKRFIVERQTRRSRTKCECRDILLGHKTPMECKFFDKLCNPLNPYGPCMVSAEGACAIAYRYKGGY